MTKKRVLGRGLNALIPTGSPTDLSPSPTELDSDGMPTDPVEKDSAGVRLIAVDAIVPNPHQPRQQMAPEPLQELANSISEHGVIQPLIVSQGLSGAETADAPAEGTYQLIAGERRLEAAKLAGLEHVPAIVKEATPEQMLELALVENIQRADLNPLEEAIAYSQLSKTFGLTQQEIAAKVGKNRVSVANALRLLRLPDFVKSVLAGGQISEGHARALLPLEKDQEIMKQALKRVIKQALSVRQTEELVRRLDSSPASPRSTRTIPPETLALENQFAQALGTKVKLTRSKKGGRLTIHFFSEEELHELYGILIGREQS